MFFHEHPFLQMFPRPLALDLQDRAKVKVYQSGEILFREGDPSDSLVLVLEGKLELFKGEAEGGNVCLREIGDGEYLGEIGVLDGSPRSAGARAQEMVTVGILKKEPFLEVMEKAPLEVMLALFKRMGSYVRQTNEALLDAVLHREKMTLVGEMANRMIHDFRNPFTHLNMIAQILSGDPGELEIKRMAQSLQRQVDRMDHMAQELLEFSRGQPTLKLQRLSARELIEVIRLDNKDILKKQGIEFVCKAENYSLEADLSKLSRVIQNLINNAVDAMEGREGSRLALEVRPNFDSLEFVLEDNGPGIPEEIRDTLFDPFVTHGKAGGTGIGLSIVKSIVEAHGGTIVCESEKDRGTTFRMQFSRLEEA